jgi:hypothetical protein
MKILLHEGSLDESDNTASKNTENGKEKDTISDNDSASLPTSTEVNIEKSSNNISFRWSQQDTLLFIRIVETHYKKFSSCLKKNVWHIIASELSNRTHKNFDSTQVDSKWKSLKQMYKKIYDHNQRTGNSQKTWEYYDAMHQILFNKPEIKFEIYFQFEFFRFIFSLSSLMFKVCSIN